MDSRCPMSVLSYKKSHGATHKGKFMKYEEFLKLSQTEIQNLFNLRFEKSETDPSQEYKVFLAKNGENDICTCLAGQNDKKCKHTPRARMRPVFKDAWWFWRDVCQKNPNELWDKCKLWASNDTKTVAKMHNITNLAITKFIEYVREKNKGWIEDSHNAMILNRKTIGIISEGRVTDEMYNDTFLSRVETHGFYHTYQMFSDIYLLKEHFNLLNKNVSEDNDCPF